MSSEMCSMMPHKRGILIALLFVAPRDCKAAAPCNLCTRGEITQPEKTISIPGYEIIDTCGTLDIFLPAVLLDDAPECELLRSISPYCGCPTPSDSCSFCPDGSRVSDPEREVPFLSEVFIGIPPTCAIVEAYLSSISDSSSLCRTGQLISSYCGCAPIENHCKFCRGEPLADEYRDVKLKQLLQDAYGNTDLGVTPTCETLYATQYQLRPQDEICRTSQFVTFHCGCNDGEFNYLGTTSTGQRAALVWVPRSVGIVSLIASLLIFWDIFGDQKKRQSVYHQLISMVAVFDCFSSMVWIIGSGAVPKTEVSDLPSGVYGAVGNEATCKGQAFFFQLGFTSVYMNVSLTVYYLLVIVYSMREQRLRRLRICLFGIPLIIGFGMAFAVIPFVYHNPVMCDVEPYGTHTGNLWQLLVFALLPVLTASFVIVVLLVFIYLKVRKTRSTMRKWSSTGGKPKETNDVIKKTTSKASMRSSARNLLKAVPSIRSIQQRKAKRDKLERDVFWQCFSYAAVFGITWPLWAVGKVRASQHDMPLGFWFLVFIVAPMQGFNNAVCYFRPFRRLSQRRRRKQKNSEVKPSWCQRSTAAIAQFFKKAGTRCSCRDRTNDFTAVVDDGKPVQELESHEEEPSAEPSSSGMDMTQQASSCSTIGTQNSRFFLPIVPGEAEPQQNKEKTERSTQNKERTESDEDNTEIPLGDDSKPDNYEVTSAQAKKVDGEGTQRKRKSFFQRLSGGFFGLDDDSFDTSSGSFGVDPVVALAQMLQEIQNEETHERRNPAADAVKQSFMRRASNIVLSSERRNLSMLDSGLIDGEIVEEGSDEGELFDSPEGATKCRSSVF